MTAVRMLELVFPTVDDRDDVEAMIADMTADDAGELIEGHWAVKAKASRRTAAERDASRHWLWRSLDDLLVVAWVAGCFGAAVSATAAGVPVLCEAITLGALLALTLVLVQYARHGRRR